MMTTRDVRWYGWKPDLPDARDILYKVGKPVIPQTVYLKDKYVMPDIFNQESLGACTGNGISYALSFLALNNRFQNVVHSSTLPFSRLFIYYNERVIENTVNQDSGAQIRDGFKCIASIGACPEVLYPYDINRFTDKPTDSAYSEALKYKAIEYERLNSSNKLALIQCLLDGFPFVLGFSVYSGFETQEVSNTGIVNMPDLSNENLLGGHCVTCVGYNVDTDRFLCANSWSDDWGQAGYFTIPASYLCSFNLADDFWVVKSVS